MAKKEKKAPLKERNPYAYYRNGYFASAAGVWGSLLGPLAVVVGVKWNEYIKVQNGAEYRMTIGAVLALIVAVVVIYKQVKHQEKVKKQVTMTSWVAGVAVAFALSWCFSAVLKDLTLILGTELAGSLSAYGFDRLEANRLEHMKIYKDEYLRSKARRKEAQEHAEAAQTPVE